VIIRGEFNKEDSELRRICIKRSDRTLCIKLLKQSCTRLSSPFSFTNYFLPIFSVLIFVQHF